MRRFQYICPIKFSFYFKVCSFITRFYILLLRHRYYFIRGLFSVFPPSMVSGCGGFNWYLPSVKGDLLCQALLKIYYTNWVRFYTLFYRCHRRSSHTRIITLLCSLIYDLHQTASTISTNIFDTLYLSSLILLQIHIVYWQFMYVCASVISSQLFVSLTSYRPKKDK